MKILMAADMYWPTINGVAVASRTLAVGLASRGHEVLVIAPSQRRSGLSYEEKDEGTTVKRTLSIPFPFYQNFRISVTPQREVKRIIEEFDPDVIHIEMVLGIGQAVMRYGNKYNIPIVTTNHAIPDNLLDNLRLLEPVSKSISYLIAEYGARFHSKADYITMPTQAAIDMLTKGRDKLPNVPLKPVSNGINLSRFKPTKASSEAYARWKVPENHTVISYVGRLDAEKHVSVLIEAFARVEKATKKPVHLMIVGAGTDEEHLKNLVFERGLDKHVTFTGKAVGPEVEEVHSLGDIFCMPSPAELQCLAALEAMASGKPVVAVDVGALYELCQTDRNGYLCETDNVEQIADSLLKLVDDEKLREKFGKESLAIAKTHDIEHTLDEYEKIYAEVMKSKTHALPQRLL